MCAGDDKSVAGIRQVCTNDREHQKLVRLASDPGEKPREDVGLVALHTALTEFQNDPAKARETVEQAAPVED